MEFWGRRPAPFLVPCHPSFHASFPFSAGRTEIKQKESPNSVSRIHYLQQSILSMSSIHYANHSFVRNSSNIYVFHFFSKVARNSNSKTRNNSTVNEYERRISFQKRFVSWISKRLLFTYIMIFKFFKDIQPGIVDNSLETFLSQRFPVQNKTSVSSVHFHSLTVFQLFPQLVTYRSHIRLCFLLLAPCKPVLPVS